jgi:NADH dehydrogenase FAD-containing subunit
MNVTIIGGGYAGLACALRLGRGSAGADAPRIRLVNPQGEFIERIRLHQVAAGALPASRPLEPLLRRAGVELVRGSIGQIDAARGTVQVGGESLGWDRLVIAVGSTIASQLPGVAANTIALGAVSAEELGARLSVLPRGARVLVVGGGLTGIETAAEIAESHPRLCVHLLSRQQLAPDWSPAARNHLRSTLLRLGVRLMLGQQITGAKPHALLSESGATHFDVCVWTAGFTMPALIAEAGLAVNRAGQALVDPQLRSISHPRIYVAGDAMQTVLWPGDRLAMGCKSAMPAGVHVASNLLRELRGEAQEAFDMATPFYCVSLGRRDGLIQFPDRWGRPRGKVLVGRAAAWWKECVSRSTWWALQLEARGLQAVRWARTGYAPQALGSSRAASEALALVRNCSE